MNIIVANFKNLLSFEAEKAYLHTLMQLEVPSSKKVIVCPSLINLSYYANNKGTLPISIGAQMCSPKTQEAQTGALLAQQIAATASKAVLIGHHETRRLYHWSYTELTSSVKNALECGLQPILCVGDLAEKENETFGKDLAWLKTLKQLDLLTDAIVAYEPMYSIGGAFSATNETITVRAQELREATDDSCPILYGGSVHSQNIQVLAQNPLDGFLVGRASTDFHELQKIVSL